MTTKMISLYTPSPSIPLDMDVRFHPELTWGEKLFLAEIKSMCNKGTCYYHQSKLAELFNVSKMSISHWIKKLSQMGYIQIIIDVNDTECKHKIKVLK